MSSKVTLTSVVFSVFRDSCCLLDLPGAIQIVSTHSNVQNWFYNSNLKYMDKPSVSFCFPTDQVAIKEEITAANCHDPL